MEIKNALIESTSLSIADHGCLSAWISLNYGGSGQSFGGFNLGSTNKAKSFKHDEGNYAGHFIIRCLQIAGVDEWKNLVGKPVRVKGDHGGIHSIGHILKDEWFCPSEDFKK